MRLPALRQLTSRTLRESSLPLQGPAAESVEVTPQIPRERSVIGLRQGGVKVSKLLSYDRGRQSFFTGEIVVKSAFRDVDGGHDIPNADGDVSIVLKQQPG